MGIKVVVDTAGRRWAYDPAMIESVIRAATRTRMIRSRSKVVVTSDAWYLPSLYHLETDWSGFRAKVESDTALFLADCSWHLRNNPSGLSASLATMLDDAIRDHRWYEENLKRCAEDSVSSIERVTRSLEAGMTLLRVVRDGSAAVLVAVPAIALGAPALAGAVGITGVTTYTATGALAVGSTLKGAYTYQDSGNVGSAVISTTATFTVGMIGLGAISSIGAAATGGEKMAIAFLSTGKSAAASLGQAIIEGKDGRQLAATGLVALGSAALGTALGARLESSGFIAQVFWNSLLDVGGGVVGGAVVDSAKRGSASDPGDAASPGDAAVAPALALAPRGGNVHFLGVPASDAERFIERHVLRRLG